MTRPVGHGVRRAHRARWPGSCMKRLAEKAGLDLRDVFHIFRRTVARNAKRQKIDTQHILGNLGWKGEQMLNRYTAAMQEEEERLKAFEDFSRP